jgi:hypothetical protein
MKRADRGGRLSWGEADRTRTYDLWVRNPTLYPLSYGFVLARPIIPKPPPDCKVAPRKLSPAGRQTDRVADNAPRCHPAAPPV